MPNNISDGLLISLNDVRNNASSRFQEVTREITSDTSIESFAQPLLNTPAIMNEFTDVLIQRIVYTQFLTKNLNNPLKVLEGDTLPLGYLGQEIYVNAAKGRKYDINDFAGALKKYESDVKVQYMGINWDYQYPVTVIRQKLKQAFVSWSALEEYITNLTQSLYNGYFRDDYRNTKNIVSNAYRSNAVKMTKINAVTSKDTAEQFVEKAREIFLNMQVPTSNYSAWKQIGGYGREICSSTPPEDIVFVLRNDIRSKLDVKVLANAFNIDKAILLGNIIGVEDFNIIDDNENIVFDGKNIIGLICDKAWFRIREQDNYMDDFRNANNRSINFYLNIIKMYNYSYFAQAMLFVTELPEVVINKLDFQAPEGITLEQVGDEEGLDITVTPATANTPTIEYTSSDEDVFVVEKDANNDRHCKITAIGTGTGTLTAKAGNVETSVTINVL